MESSHIKKPDDNNSHSNPELETTPENSPTNIFDLARPINPKDKNQIMHLQRTIGNQATMRLLQSQQTKQDSSENVRRVFEAGGDFSEKHVLAGGFFMSEVEPIAKSGTPVIVELMEFDTGSIMTKLKQVVASGAHLKRPLAFVFAVNKPLGKNKDSVEGFGKSAITNALKERQVTAIEIVEYMEANDLSGGCFPMVWAPTSVEEGGYTFPFEEARASVTAHPGVKSLHEMMYNYGNVVVRSMDADIFNDPLLTKGPVSDGNGGTVKDELDEGLEKLQLGEIELLTGGYDWNMGDITPQKLVSLGIEGNVNLVKKPLIDFLQSAIAWINFYEHSVRESISAKVKKAIYFPEPNTYMQLGLRQKGAQSMIEHARTLGSGDAQQKESTFSVNKMDSKSDVLYDSRISTHKPLKDYFDTFLVYLAKVYKGTSAKSKSTLMTKIQGLRQTHLDIEKIESIMTWHKIANNSVLSELAPIVEENLNGAAEDILKRLEG